MTQYEPAAHMPPPPETLSAEARAYLAATASAGPPPMMSMDQIDHLRFFADQIQLMLGAEQQKAHPVTITDDVVAGVPVRRIVRTSGVVDRIVEDLGKTKLP